MEQPTLTGFRAELKQRTSELHHEVHGIPYIQALLKNELPALSYVGYLKALAIIYGALEKHVLGQEGEKLKPFLHHYLRKLPLLLSDLDDLDGSQTPDILPAVGQALIMADAIMVHSISRPYALLGYLYTLDGALNGGSILKKHLSNALGLTGDTGIRYFSCFGSNYRDFWMNFLGALDNHLPDDTARESVVLGATEAFAGLIALYKMLHPVDKAMLGTHITSLNPEAGHYPITTDPHEIEAAVKAGLACWNHYPFYEERFGERGRRFAISDAAWLVGLCELPLETAVGQIRWLANFLSLRGMPSITMEMQLHTLHHELGSHSPHKKPRYHNLLDAATVLKKGRLSVFDQRTFIEADNLFNKQLKDNNVSDQRLIRLSLHMGSLIASSMADGSLWQEASRASFESWLTDESVFPEPWINAVKTTYQLLEKRQKQP
ncbi:MAG TPA: hypothetical protein DD409_12360 [Bacteroidales bacterium]|nr:hypothetical protein [Bacteroidales bacterium]